MHGKVGRKHVDQLVYPSAVVVETIAVETLNAREPNEYSQQIISSVFMMNNLFNLRSTYEYFSSVSSIKILRKRILNSSSGEKTLF